MLRHSVTLELCAQCFGTLYGSNNGHFRCTMYTLDGWYLLIECTHQILWLIHLIAVTMALTFSGSLLLYIFVWLQSLFFAVGDVLPKLYWFWVATEIECNTLGLIELICLRQCVKPFFLKTTFGGNGSAFQTNCCLLQRHPLRSYAEHFCSSRWGQ